MKLCTSLLTFCIDENAGQAGFMVDGRESEASFGSDFWRIILDDGQRTEINVFSHKQTGKAALKDDRIIIEYHELLSEYGDRYQIYFRLEVAAEGNLFRFLPYLENHETGVRVNECFCPLADFTSLYGDKEKDVLYMPNGLGMRVPNPWRVLQGMTNNYFVHDPHEVFWHMPYPRATMSWFGVQSGNRFLYMARYDEKTRYCFLTIRQRIHVCPTNMMFGIDHFPALRPGETLTLPSSVIGMLEGDWRTGADLYRAWAEKAFYRVTKKADWIQRLTGWQCIVMRSQYGEDYYLPEDLPRLYQIGAKYGIHTLLLFGWWKEGMDRNYPIYTEAYPGAFEVLRENIHKVQEMGGRVILECNGQFMDPSSSFYKEHGKEVCILDINGNEVRGGFTYPSYGELRADYGRVPFTMSCACSKRWRDQIMSVMKLMREMNPDCLFADCYGGYPIEPCFNHQHEHGYRVDEEWEGRRKLFDEINAYCEQEDKVFGVEIVTDIAASYTQFIHGLINVDFRVDGSVFPQMFRYTFPEVITTNRGVYSEDGDYVRQLKCALVSGVRLDLQFFAARGTLADVPNLAEIVKYYTSCQEKYQDFLFYGTYTVLDASPLPYFVKRGEYYDSKKERILRILYNASADPVTIGELDLAADEMRFDVFSVENYELYLTQKRQNQTEVDYPDLLMLNQAPGTLPC